MKDSKPLLLITLVLLLLASCRLPMNVTPEIPQEGNIQTQVAGTIAAMAIEGTQVGIPDAQAPQEVVSPTGTMTLSPTVTLTPTITLTVTPEKPMVSVSEDTNCRTGPGKLYDYIGALLQGEVAEVVGQSEDGQYWIIQNPDREGECWLWGQYATVTGPTAALPRYTPPPTPTPAFDWAGTWTSYYAYLTGEVFSVNSIVVTVSEKDFTGIEEYSGFVGTYSGTINDDYLTVSGTWVWHGESGSFKLYALGVNQFQGYYTADDQTIGFCGARGGAGMPSPCYKH